MRIGTGLALFARIHVETGACQARQAWRQEEEGLQMNRNVVGILAERLRHHYNRVN